MRRNSDDRFRELERALVADTRDERLVARYLGELKRGRPPLVVRMRCASCGLEEHDFEAVADAKGALDFVGSCGWQQTSEAGGCAEMLDGWLESWRESPREESLPDRAAYEQYRQIAAQQSDRYGTFPSFDELVRQRTVIPRRRNSDEAFRRLHRKVVEGDITEIPALARAYARRGGGPLSDAVLRDVVASFTNLEAAADAHDGPADIFRLFVDIESYPECDENAVVNAEVGYIKGVADGTGFSYAELWALSEKERGGAGAARLASRSGACSRCGRVMPQADLTEVQSDSEDPMATEPVCGSCWDVMSEAGDIISPPPRRRAAQAARAAMAVGAEDSVCNCAHVRGLHANGTGRCSGTGAQLDPEYGVPPDQPCACTMFEPGD